MFSERDEMRIARSVVFTESISPSTLKHRSGGGAPNVPEVRTANITSTTVDANGRYPALLQTYNMDDEDWDDNDECRVESLAGDLGLGRISVIRIGDDGTYPVFSAGSGMGSASDTGSAKRYVRAAATGNITLSGEQTIDGVSIVADEDVLAPAQTAPAENGIYTAASGSWTRRSDADSWDELVGALVVVTEGTTLADTLWMCTSDAGGTLDSTSVTWQRIDPAVGALTVEAGPTEASGSASNVTTLKVNNADITQPSANVALVQIHDASASQSGLVNLTAQTYLGAKTFASGVTINNHLSQDYQVILTSLTEELAWFKAVAENASQNKLDIQVSIEDSTPMSLVASLRYRSNGGTPTGVLDITTTGGGGASAFSVNSSIGGSGTVSGITFSGGLYISGDTSITVSQISDIGSTYQPLDADLTAIAALAGTDNIYYRSGANTWTSVTIGTGLAFSGGTLSASGSGDVTSSANITDNAVVRGDGGAKGVQDSGVLINDSDEVSGVTELTISLTNTDTTTVASVFQLEHLSSNTPDVGFGTSFIMTAKSATVNSRELLLVSSYWATATDASRKARTVFSVYDTAAREALRLEASGSAAMVGFLGTAAAVQQTGDAGTALVTFGLMSGTPTFAFPNLTGFGTIVLHDQQTSGTNGGTFTSGADRTRTLNTEVSDSGGNCSLASNQFTLTAGTYEILAFAPAGGVDQHRAFLYNATGATTLLSGSAAWTYSGGGNVVIENSIITGKFTVAASQALEIRHRCTTTRATDGFGVASSLGTEIYTIVFLMRVA
jgi:hypothetical protein